MNPLRYQAWAFCVDHMYWLTMVLESDMREGNHWSKLGQYRGALQSSKTRLKSKLPKERVWRTFLECASLLRYTSMYRWRHSWSVNQSYLSLQRLCSEEKNHALRTPMPYAQQCSVLFLRLIALTWLPTAMPVLSLSSKDKLWRDSVVQPNKPLPLNCRTRSSRWRSSHKG